MTINLISAAFSSVLLARFGRKSLLLVTTGVCGVALFVEGGAFNLA
jgi:hypothetical protein